MVLTVMVSPPAVWVAGGATRSATSQSMAMGYNWLFMRGRTTPRVRAAFAVRGAPRDRTETDPSVLCRFLARVAACTRLTTDSFARSPVSQVALSISSGLGMT